MRYSLAAFSLLLLTGLYLPAISAPPPAQDMIEIAIAGTGDFSFAQDFKVRLKEGDEGHFTLAKDGMPQQYRYTIRASTPSAEDLRQLPIALQHPLAIDVKLAFAESNADWSEHGHFTVIAEENKLVAMTIGKPGNIYTIKLQPRRVSAAEHAATSITVKGEKTP